MNVIQSEQILPCDIDFTLLMWGKIKKGDKVVSFLDPYTGEQKLVKVNLPNLKVVTSRLARGATVLVWSASGYKWARAALKALKLDHKNIYVLSKPIGYVDDKPSTQWMGEQIYLDEQYGWK